MDAASKTNTARDRDDTALIEACERLVRDGRAVCYDTMRQLTGKSYGSIKIRIARLRRDRRFPFDVRRASIYGATMRWEQLARIAAKMHEDGEPISCAALVAKTGWEDHGIYSHIRLARLHGAFPWDIIPADRGKAAKEGLQRQKQKDSEDIEELKAAIESRKKAELARCYAEMGAIDGTNECDDPPHGTPPRSNRDHTAWNRMKFSDRNVEHGPDLYCRTVHRIRTEPRRASY